MKTSFSRLFALLILSTACAVPHALQPAAGVSAAESSSVQQFPALTGDVLFSLMASEVALQRGSTDSAALTLMKTAEKTGNPDVARRAFEILNTAGHRKRAQSALNLWKKTAEKSHDDSSEEAARAFSLLYAGNTGEAAPLFRRLLKDAESPDPLLQQIFASLSGRQVADVLPFLEETAAPYADRNPRAGIVLARAFSISGNKEKALRYGKAAAKASDSSAVVRQVSEALLRTDPAGADAIASDYAEKHPDDMNFRIFALQPLFLARGSGAAEKEIRQIAESPVLSSEERLQLADAAVKSGLPAEAESILQNMLGSAEKDKTDTIRYRLAVLADAAGHPEEAVLRYSRVKGGAFYRNAKLREAGLCASAGRYPEAADILENALKNTENLSEQADFLRGLAAVRDKTDGPAAALLLMRSRVSGLSEVQPSILAEAAMYAEKAGDFESAEFYLRKYLAKEPDSAEANNDLGYLLADRNVHLQEARKLIEKANALTPGSASVLDSLGWVNFRLGRLETAEHHLRKSLQIKENRETLGHLLEVLIAKGEKTRASEELASHLEKNPQDKELLRLKERFGL